MEVFQCLYQRATDCIFYQKQPSNREKGSCLISPTSKNSTFVFMDSNSIVYGTLIGGLIGTVIFFFLLEATIVEALKKFKKWEAKESEKTN